MNEVQPGKGKGRRVAESAYLLDRVGAGDSPPCQVNAVVGIPKCGSVKYEVDSSTGLVFVDRFLYTSTRHPFNYWFIPGARGEDGDYLDALVITEEPVYPMSVVRLWTIGVLLMEDEEGLDPKIVTVPDKNIGSAYSSLRDVRQIPDFALKQIEHFFAHRKVGEPGKFVRVHLCQGRSAAESLIRSAIVAFKEG